MGNNQPAPQFPHGALKRFPLILLLYCPLSLLLMCCFQAKKKAVFINIGTLMAECEHSIMHAALEPDYPQELMETKNRTQRRQISYSSGGQEPNAK